jgi:carbon starvation protein
MTSILFIVIAAIFGFFVYRKNMPVGPATIVGIIGIVAIVFIGQEVGLHFSRTFWVLFIAVYVTVASLLPVWILLQPRDYLSSFLLYGMMALAVIAIVGATFTGAATVEAPAFYGWKNPAGQPLFPFLFITVACGACSGFHSLISSGTSSKQINNEKDAQIIGYGSMVIESALGVIALIAIGVVWSKTSAGGGDQYQLSAPPTIFAGGIATMFASFAGEKSYGIIYNLFTLAVSVFALTSLDSATRLCRYLFAELLTPEGKSHEDLTGAAKFFSTPIVSTLIMVVIGCGMGFMGLSQIWSVFGSANQLLAGVAMLAVCTWLGKIGRNNKMFFFPMVFMLCATICALCITIFKNFGKIAAGADWGTWFQTIWSIALVVLAVILAVTAFKTLSAQAKQPKRKKA